jgi:hypothetical protein
MLTLKILQNKTLTNKEWKSIYIKLSYLYTFRLKFSV